MEDQRRAEIRLDAVKEFNRLTNAYVAACIVPDERKLLYSEWLRNLNVVASTIRVLFSNSAFDAAKKVNDSYLKPFAVWDRDPDKMQRAHAFADACYEVLAVLYGEVIPLPIWRQRLAAMTAHISRRTNGGGR
ncbi:MAG TPA: hypothetical protein VE201_07170 [Nitrospirales bacterium]|nr:hypothetical protein [Nitrospirales bacterium]